MRGVNRGRVARAAAAGTLSILVLATLPPWYRALPWPVQKYFPYGLLASVALILLARPERFAGLRIPTETWGALDDIAGRFLGRWLPCALVAACLIQLAGWVPHYLTWP